jgi:2-polyprenyl-3-methyl-5-hydroxy-6-metoxy-1,4-benzoquinol methylase
MQASLITIIGNLTVIIIIMRTGYTKEQDERHTLRLKRVLKVLMDNKVENVIDMGCGDGQLLELLSEDKQFKTIQGIDSNPDNLRVARQFTNKNRVKLYLGSFDTLQKIYKSQTITMVEVIEHINPSKLLSVEQILFSKLKPHLIVLTTPLSDESVKGGIRTKTEIKKLGHYFEWTNKECKNWADKIANLYNYKYKIKDIRVSPNQRGSNLVVFSSK